MTDDPEKLETPIAELRARFGDTGRDDPEVAVFGACGQREEAEGLERLAALEALGVTEFIQRARYADPDGFQSSLALSGRRETWLER